MKLLAINADDFGFTSDVNAGIVEAHRNGILTSTTLMANGQAFDDAVRLTRDTPSLDVGCHLVLVQGVSLCDGRAYPESPLRLAELVLRRKIDAYLELRPQVEKILAAGIKPTHLDTHKHTHLLPAVFRALVRLANEYAIPYIRLPVDTTLPLAAAVRSRYARYLQGPVKTTDHFLGFRLTGSLDLQSFAAALRHIPSGFTEFMCHPGKLGFELQSAPTRLKESRVRELEALTSPRIRDLLAAEGIRTCPFQAR